MDETPYLVVLGFASCSLCVLCGACLGKGWMGFLSASVAACRLGVCCGSADHFDAHAKASKAYDRTPDSA